MCLWGGQRLLDLHYFPAFKLQSKVIFKCLFALCDLNSASSIRPPGT